MISLPVGAQSASSNMTVHCSKNSPYTINLSYDGISGQTKTLETGSLTGSAYQYGPSNSWEYYCTYQFNYNGTNVSFATWQTKNCTSTAQTNYVTSCAYGQLSGLLVVIVLHIPYKYLESLLKHGLMVILPIAQLVQEIIK